MIKQGRVALSVFAVMLGTAHVIYGVVAFTDMSPNMLWFMGAGIAMIVSGFANFQKSGTFVLRVQNGVILAYVAALAVYMPLPQVLLVLFLFSALFVLSWKRGV